MDYMFELPSTPPWCKPSYLTVSGSRSYGTNNINSDWDFVGFTVPPVELVFPHTAGVIPGFGRQIKHFENFQFQDGYHSQFGKYDLTIYSIVKYFQLVMEGNPNMVDSLFTDWKLQVVSDAIGWRVWERRHLFLSQKCYHTFKGMMWSHLSRLKGEHTKEGRLDLKEKYGWDTKDGYHSVRMMLELKQILFNGDLELQKDKNYLLDIRNGKVSKDEALKVCEDILKELESKQDKFVVPYAPDESAIKNLLIQCLEMKYGDLNKFGFNILS